MQWFKDFFSVHRATGAVVVARPLEREIAAIVRLTVLVTDITAPIKQQGTGNEQYCFCFLKFLHSFTHIWFI